jgi:hypothetical protein
LSAGVRIIHPRKFPTAAGRWRCPIGRTDFKQRTLPPWVTPESLYVRRILHVRSELRTPVREGLKTTRRLGDVSRKYNIMLLYHYCYISYTLVKFTAIGASAVPNYYQTPFYTLYTHRGFMVIRRFRFFFVCSVNIMMFARYVAIPILLW